MRLVQLTNLDFSISFLGSIEDLDQGQESEGAGSNAGH